MNLKNFLAAPATLFATSMVAQDNIQDVRDNYNIGQTVTVVGVVTSDDNLGSVRYLQDASAGIAIYPGQDWSSWDATPQIGDSLSVTGEITEYNGLLEVGPNLDDVEFFGTGTLPDPQSSRLHNSVNRSRANSFKSTASRFSGRTFIVGNNTTTSLLAVKTASFTFGQATRWSERN